MADGLSLVANIIAVVQLVGGVGRYINEVKGASKSLKDFEREIESLRSILLKLRTFAEENPVIADSWSLTAPLDKCAADMTRINLELALVPKKKIWGIQLFWCQWPFKEKETLGFIERSERLKSIFILAMGELQQSQLRNIENNVQHLVQAAQGSYESTNIEDQSIQHDKPNREVVINWLYAEAFDKRHTEISGRRQPNTGEWMLKEPEVQNWENGKSKSRLLWGYGIPGAGKTFLSSLVIDHLKKRARASTQSKCGVAYIYFNYSEQAQQTPLLVLSNLTKQLACQLQELPTEVNKLYKNITDKQKTPSLEERYNLLRIIAKAFVPGNVFLVCDALDECKQDTQRKILLPLFHRMANDGMNLFITSREYPDDIQTSFKNSSKVKLRAKNEDINFYIQQKIAEHPRAHRLVESARCQNEIVYQLKKCANGMFLMVSFHVKYLCQQVNVKQLLAALKKLNDSSSKGEPTMDPTYDRAIESIKRQEGNCVELALKILFWLASAQRVLTVRELQIAVSIENDCATFDKTALADRNTLLDVCAGLMTIDQENNEEENDLKDTVRLAHYTIQEYLLRKSIISNDGDIQIATACISFISYDNFTQGACISGKSDEYRSYLHTFLEYVVVYLIVHLRECDETLTTQLVLQFLENPQLFLVYVEGHLLLDDPYCSRPTPLHFAAGLEHTRVTKSLLERGATITAVDIKGYTALHHAAEMGHESIVKLLLEMGADIKAVDNDGWTALHSAASWGYESMVKLLLEMGADIKAVDNYGWTALHLAAEEHEPVVKLLLEMGADIKAVDNDGWTALHSAARSGHEPVVKLLLEMGADIKAVKNDGWTALHLAAYNEKEPVVKLLLEMGADIKAVDNDGQTALHCAARSGHESVVKLLLEMGADIKAVKNDGWTALHLAAYNEKEPVVKLLLEMGADIKAVDNDGQTAMDLTDSRTHWKVVQLLEKYMVTGTAVVETDENAGGEGVSQE